MLRTKRPGFSIKDVFVVHPSRDLKFNGKTYQRCTIFPWKENGCSARRLNLLFESRKVLSEFEIDGELKATVILEENQNINSSSSDLISDELNYNSNTEGLGFIENELEVIQDNPANNVEQQPAEFEEENELTEESASSTKRNGRRRNRDKNDNKDVNKPDKLRPRRKLIKPRA